jgi:adenine-specific DNA-methyltransferase
MSKYDDLVKKLKEIFQIDKPELDFGVYRILNARSTEITDYLENRLKAKVLESLSEAGSANVENLRHDLAEAEKNAVSLGVSPDSVPKVLELRQRIAEYSTGSSEHENAVFSHLLTFFSRYYESGDFISQRRYKGDTYAIPYAGEEVMLHWANKDQYYTKSGENFSNYAFKLDDGRTVRFKLVAADTAKDNRKDNDKERRFVLIEEKVLTLVDDEGDEYEETLMPLEELNGELVIHFEYKAMPKGSKQEDEITKAVKTILESEIVKGNWIALANREPTESNPKRTLLEKCLVNYTSSNTSDYFIHKDLGGFLRGELDFYIKNEVMHLDDVQNAEKFADIEKNLRLIQTLRSIALDLVTFLAQLEDFQKKLWLKKKFVIAANYCVTLDRIPELLYTTIAANELQWEQWRKLGMLDGGKTDLLIPAKIGSIEYLKAHPFLMADTALFDAKFKNTLLASIDNLDESVDGLLINADNFQALNLLQDSYQSQINSIYIDPPYNTDASSIVYKNGYKDSTWSSLMENRIEISKNLLTEDGIICAAIDDEEVSELRFIMSSHFEKLVGITVVRSNPAGRKTKGKFAPAHEYGLFYGNSDLSIPLSLSKSEKSMARYPKEDVRGRFSWANFIRSGNNDRREDRPKLFYPIFVSSDDTIRIPKMQWDDASQSYLLLEQPKLNEEVVYPIMVKDGRSIEKNWQRGHARVPTELDEYRVRRTENNKANIDFKTRMDEESLPVTWWDEKGYASANYGASELKELFSEKEFDFPKARQLVFDSLKVAGLKNDNTIALDFFAGSGTTGHAVVNINREYGGRRKYILIEQGEYFQSVTKPRMQKVVYSADWKNGKAMTPQTGVSHAFKVLKLESYEDTLNNLQLRRSKKQMDMLNNLPSSAKDDYLLSYMLDIESRGSFLNIEQFNTPFDCKLNVAVDSAGATAEYRIDMVETFNYLIGLRVKHIDIQPEQGFVSIIGTLPTAEKALVLWRDVNKVDYSALNKLCDKLAINPADNEFDVVYINGDHNIPSVFTGTEKDGGITKRLALRQIESEFLSRMFAVDNV